MPEAALGTSSKTGYEGNPGSGRGARWFEFATYLAGNLPLTTSNARNHKLSWLLNYQLHFFFEGPRSTLEMFGGKASSSPHFGPVDQIGLRDQTGTTSRLSMLFGHRWLSADCLWRGTMQNSQDLRSPQSQTAGVNHQISFSFMSLVLLMQSLPCLAHGWHS